MSDFNENVQESLKKFNIDLGFSEQANIANRKKLQDRIDTMTKYLEENGSEIDENHERTMIEPLRDLLVLCQEVDQTSNVSELDNFIETRKVLQVRIPKSRPELELIYGSSAVGVYGLGLFFMIDGIMTSESYKKTCGYTEWESGNKKAFINLKDIPDTYRKDLIIPALNGLFIPKKSPLMDEVERQYQLTFFDAR